MSGSPAPAALRASRPALKGRGKFEPSAAASLFKTTTIAARETALFRRLRPEWQDEGHLLDGLGKSAHLQAWMVVDAKLAERRRFVLGGMVKWKLRLAGGK